ncbi:MAG TPA: universal stress protein [Frankiaceae bacterium]|jgi:nucleotide-binding universal stress UspA family protein|nr:universal stress protein [Frankiaceae bacterium]
MSDRPLARGAHGTSSGKARRPSTAPDPAADRCAQQSPSIVVGVDGSECSMRAVSYAAGLARRQGAALVAVYVRKSPSGFAYLANTPGALAAVVEAESVAEIRIRDEVAEECAVCGIEGSLVVRIGSSVRAVIETADELQAHAVIVGSRPRLIARFLPSGMGRLIGRAGRPVVLVP